MKKESEEPKARLVIEMSPERAAALQAICEALNLTIERYFEKISNPDFVIANLGIEGVTLEEELLN